MTPALLQRLMAAQAEGRQVALLTSLADGTQFLWPDDQAPTALGKAAQASIDSDEAANLTHEGTAWFIEPRNPPLRMLIVGAVHIAQALAPMAPAMGFSATIIDPRRAFATDLRFPGVTLIDEWPDDAMAALKPDARTAIITLTHDPKLDDPAIDAALKSPAFYIGALGSRRTHAKRVARLSELGHDQAAMARIHAPVGLNIEAVTAAEIALSIMAEVVAARRGAVLGAPRPVPKPAVAA